MIVRLKNNGKYHLPKGNLKGHEFPAVQVNNYIEIDAKELNKIIPHGFEEPGQYMFMPNQFDVVEGEFVEIDPAEQELRLQYEAELEVKAKIKKDEDFGKWKADKLKTKGEK